MKELSGTKRLRRACELSDAMLKSIRGQIKAEHPEWSEANVTREYWRREGVDIEKLMPRKVQRPSS
jgi:hypothetical protein